MDDAVKKRAAALQAEWNKEEAARSSDAERMQTLLTDVSSGVQEALRRQTNIAVEADPAFDEFEPEHGWLTISARIVGPRAIDSRPMIVIRINVFEGTVFYSIEDQGTGSAYLAGAPFEGDAPVSKEATINLAVDVVVETLAHLMANGNTLDREG
ncbi:MAG: hypothetical protein JSS00_06220 [Proteobacteria bacterium]|nr:hypothetical protein [Pseudomonadota bacterium]